MFFIFKYKASSAVCKMKLFGTCFSVPCDRYGTGHSGKCSWKQTFCGKVMKSIVSGSCISLNSGELLVNVMIMHDTITGISRTLKNTSA
jgi:hypothetical protein